MWGAVWEVSLPQCRAPRCLLCSTGGHCKSMLNPPQSSAISFDAAPSFWTNSKVHQEQIWGQITTCFLRMAEVGTQGGFGVSSLQLCCDGDFLQSPHWNQSRHWFESPKVDMEGLSRGCVPKRVVLNPPGWCHLLHSGLCVSGHPSAPLQSALASDSPHAFSDSPHAFSRRLTSSSMQPPLPSSPFQNQALYY